MFIKELHDAGSRNRSRKIVLDPTHAAHCFFRKFPPGLQFCLIRTRNSGLGTAFSPGVSLFLKSPPKPLKHHNTPPHSLNQQNCGFNLLCKGSVHNHILFYIYPMCILIPNNFFLFFTFYFTLLVIPILLYSSNLFLLHFITKSNSCTLYIWQTK